MAISSVKSLSTSLTSDGTSYSIGSTYTTHITSKLGSDPEKFDAISSSSSGQFFSNMGKGGNILSVAGLLTILKTASCFPSPLLTLVISFKAFAFF